MKMKNFLKKKKNQGKEKEKNKINLKIIKMETKSKRKKKKKKNPKTNNLKSSESSPQTIKTPYSPVLNYLQEDKIKYYFIKLLLLEYLNIYIFLFLQGGVGKVGFGEDSKG